jgi:hypothetical protein
MKKILPFLVCSLVALSMVTQVQAEYVLPYPSFMPGNKIYKISRVVDTLKEYWSFGNLAKAKYYLNTSDKTLVEAKTLFEYKQYLLAVAALTRSDEHFQKVDGFLALAEQEGKDVTVWRKHASEAARVHEKVLESLIVQTPEFFDWQPEKDSATALPIHQLLKTAIQVRRTL